MNYHYLLIIVFVAFLGCSYYLGYTPVALAVLFLLASAVAYTLYARDKTAARQGAWRVPENSLHLAGLLFGWPGALVAQQRLRHKTKKKRFRAVFWFTVLLNLAGVAWLHTPQGNNQLRYGAFQLENFAIGTIPYAAPVSGILFLTEFRTRQADWWFR